MVRLRIVPKLGSKKMVDITRGGVQKLYNEKTEYSISIVRPVKTVMNVSMRYAVDKKIIPVSPAEEINLPKKVEKKQEVKISIGLMTKKCRRRMAYRIYDGMICAVHKG